MSDTEVQSRVPIYLQLRDHLAQSIATGAWPAHTRLPSERELAEQHRTTRVTTRLALAQLEAEGRIYRANRRGWFVSSPRLIYNPTFDYSFTDYVTAQGGKPRTETLSAQQISVAPWLAARTGLIEGSAVYCIQRRRYIDGRPVLVERIHVNPQACPDLLRFSFDQSLWTLMREHYGVELTRKQIQMYPTALTDPQASALGVNSGTAGLYVDRLSHNAEGLMVEFDEEYWLHDVLCIAVEVCGQTTR